jgi:YegS/Rv2252/BmrU family lipid kinase
LQDAFRSFVIVNRAAAAGATGRRFKRIASLLRDSLGDFRVAFTRSPGDATRLARIALDSGFEMVVAVGGDGTLNEVVGGFFEGARPVNPDAVLGVIALGTGSDFGRTLEQRDLESACARLADRKTQIIDVGLASFTGHDGRPSVRPFINVASFGVSGLVARLVNSRLKALSGQLAFTLATVRALAVHKDHTVTLQFDEHPPRTVALTNGAFGNGRYFGAGMQVTPTARLDDGELDVTLWSGFGLPAFIRLRRALYDGSHVREPGVQVLKTRRARVTSVSRVMVELDGESVGTLPLQVEILPGALRLKV